MTISDYQIDSVIRTYTKNMKIRVRQVERSPDVRPRDDEVNISEDGMRRMLLDRFADPVAEQMRHDGEDK
jgi:hypothetical protein